MSIALIGGGVFKGDERLAFPQLLERAKDSLREMPAGSMLLDLARDTGCEVIPMREDDDPGYISYQDMKSLRISPRFKTVKQVREAVSHDLCHLWQKQDPAIRNIVEPFGLPTVAHGTLNLLGRRVVEGGADAFKVELDAFYDGKSVTDADRLRAFNGYQNSASASSIDKDDLIQVASRPGVRDIFNPEMVRGKLPDFLKILVPNLNSSQKPYVADKDKDALCERLLAIARGRGGTRLMKAGVQLLNRA